MNIFSRTGIFFLISAVALSCSKTPAQETEEPVKPKNSYVESMYVNGQLVNAGGTVSGVDPADITLKIVFSNEIDMSELSLGGISMSNGIGSDFTVMDSGDPYTLELHLNRELKYFSSYYLYVSEGENLGLNIIDTYDYTINTEIDPTPKFEEIPDEDLMTLVQKQTFSYFWDYAHPDSGLAGERLNSGNTVTSGGSGFGIMTIPVAVSRGFISREEAVERMLKIVTFLDETAETFHGAFPHWLDGSTGKVIPFSSNDNGADLVETAFLIQGLLTVKEFFDGETRDEQLIREKITSIWERVEWSWFRKNGENRLYWHWSPDKDWAMNMPVSGWNEGLIVYVLAASSPTYPVDRQVYDEGWTGNGSFRNGKEFYGIELPLGQDYGGPLFFTHYSFLGLDPRNLSDAYADYWEQNTAHARINHAYCKDNPKGWYGYSDSCWGLTASDYPDGYTASSPTNDTGTIAPTAALSSFPYTPEESMAAMKYFYYILGDRLWGEYGFKDAFNLDRRWIASSYIAIDQGPIVIMMENYRTGLLWDLFMKNSDILTGLSRLGFTVSGQSAVLR